MTHFHIACEARDDFYRDTFGTMLEVLDNVALELDSLADDDYAMISTHGGLKDYHSAYVAFTRYTSRDIVGRNVKNLAHQLRSPVADRAPLYRHPDTTEDLLDTAVQSVLTRVSEIAPIVVTSCAGTECAPRDVDPGQLCEWFAFCFEPATGMREHPLMPDVPVCPAHSENEG